MGVADLAEEVPVGLGNIENGANPSSDELPHWVKRFVSTGTVQKIEDEIRSAEKLTTGEIVPMVVRRSSTIGHIGPLLFAIFGLLYLSLDLSLWHSQVLHSLSEIIPLGDYFLWGVDFVLLWLLSLMLARLSFFQRLCTNPLDRQSQVRMRAEVEFYEAGLNETQGSTGILIFVSLMERQVVVLADKSIATRLPPETWSSLVNELVSDIRKKQMAVGFAKAVQSCGKILAQHFPAQAENPNELKDHFIVKE